MTKKRKEKKEKSSGYFDSHYAKEKLKWKKEAIRIRESPEYSKEQKEEAYRTIKRRVGREEEQSQIRGQEREIYKKSILGRTERAIDRVLSKPMLKKPSVTLIPSLSAEKAIMRGTGNLALVREIERREYSPDNRSLFFNDSYNKEKEKERKWLS